MQVQLTNMHLHMHFCLAVIDISTCNVSTLSHYSFNRDIFVFVINDIFLQENRI